MSAPSDREHCAWTQERVEAYIDGELTAEERGTLEAHVDACGVCRSELALAGRIVNGLRSLPALTGPDHLIDDVVGAAEGAHVGAHEPAGAAARSGRFWGRLGERFAQYAQRPALAAATVLIVAASVLVLSNLDRTLVDRPVTNGELDSVEVTADELEMAKNDVMLAFAYLGKYSQKTGYYVRDDVIGERIVVPMHKAITAAGNAASTSQ